MLFLDNAKVLRKRIFCNQIVKLFFLMQKEIWQWNLFCRCGCDKLSYFTDHFKVHISTSIAQWLVPFSVSTSC